MAGAVLLALAAHTEAQQAGAQAEQWALLIGVSDYPGDIQDLRFARNDARAVKDLLLSAGGVREDHIRLLTDDGAGEAKATKQNIFAAVDQYLAPRVRHGDQVIVFLAGHGIVRGLGAQARCYFLPADVDAQSKDSTERTGIEIEELARKVGALKASQFTIFVDTCREDPFPGRGIKGNTMTDVMSRGLRVTAGPAQTARVEPPTSVIFYSCQIGERAYEDPTLEHGIFTYFILRGIRELASRPDGRVEAGQLAEYLRTNVRKWADEASRRTKFAMEQTPTMSATEVRGPIVVVRVTPFAASLPPAPRNATLTLVTSPEGAALSLNGQAMGNGPLQKELAAGQYTVRAAHPGFQPIETKIEVLAGYGQEFTIRLTPAKANLSYDKGVQFEAQALWPQAIASYEQALREDPGLVAAYDRLTDAYIQSHRYRDAADLMTIAAQKLPNDASVLARYSRALSAWARVDEAQDVSANPRPDKAIKQKSARKEAVRVGELATQKDPSLAAAHIALGFAFVLEESDRPKALAAFVRGSVAAPGDPEAYFGIGYTHRLMKQYQQAVPQLKKATELRPDYYEARRELAYCYHALGDRDRAIQQYEVASANRGKTDDSGEMAGNNLALSALYTQKGQETSGEESKAYTQAGEGYESDARELDPTMKAALKVLTDAGVSSRIQNYLPSELRQTLDELVSPGKFRIPVSRPKWP